MRCYRLTKGWFFTMSPILDSFRIAYMNFFVWNSIPIFAISYFLFVYILFLKKRIGVGERFYLKFCGDKVWIVILPKKVWNWAPFFDLHLQYWDIIYNMSTCLFFKSRFSFFASKGWKERGKLARGKQEKREGKAWYLYMSTNDIINVCTIIQNITIYI